MSWRDNVSETRPMLSLGDFEGSIVLSFDNDGEEVTTEVEDEDGSSEEIDSVKFGVTYEQGAPDHTDKNGDALQEGEEYFLYTGSARLLNQLKRVAGNLQGKTIEITADGRNFDRAYKAEEA